MLKGNTLAIAVKTPEKDWKLSRGCVGHEREDGVLLSLLS